MLILTRAKSETIVVGDIVRVTVVEVRGDRVRLGVDAPKEVEVHRLEVYQAIQRGHAKRRSQPTPAPPKRDESALLKAAKELLALMDEVPIDPALGDETDRVFPRYEFDDLRSAIARAEPTSPTNP